jgi:hypothetical protein
LVSDKVLKMSLRICSRDKNVSPLPKNTFRFLGNGIHLLNCSPFLMLRVCVNIYNLIMRLSSKHTVHKMLKSAKDRKGLETPGFDWKRREKTGNY